MTLLLRLRYKGKQQNYSEDQQPNEAYETPQHTPQYGRWNVYII